MANIKVRLDWEIIGIISKGKIDNLPTYSGIYMILCANQNEKKKWETDSYKFLYIGEARDIKDRFNRKTDEEWKCLTANCNDSLLIKTAKTDLDDDERIKVECCLINHNDEKLSKCQTECIGNWPHSMDTVEIKNSGKFLPLKESYKCG
jgi:hypothetical protein